MSDTKVTTVVRSVSWRDLCPWLLLVRAFSVAANPGVLLLATVAVLMLPLGWDVAEWLFLPDNDPASLAAVRLQWKEASTASNLRESAGEVGANIAGVFASARYVVVSIAESVKGLELRRLAFFLMGGLWTLLIASVIGGAISRKAVVVLGREQRESLGAALSHALKRLLGYLLAPIYPLLLISLIAIGCALLGLCMRLGAGAWLGAVLWPLVLLGGAVAAIQLIGLFFGWPLMWGAVSAEEDGEPFEALSRAYSYVFGRPLHLAFYGLVAAVIGGLGLLVITMFVQLTVDFAMGAIDWGAAGAVSKAVAGESDGLHSGAGVWIWLQNRFAITMAMGFQFAYFWAAASGIYLLMRLAVDQTELDEVFMPDDIEPLSLPSLQIDGTGAVSVKSEKTDDAPTPPNTADTGPGPDATTSGATGGEGEP